MSKNRFQPALAVAGALLVFIAGCTATGLRPGIVVTKNYTDSTGKTLTCKSSGDSQTIDPSVEVDSCLKQAQANGTIGTTLVDPDPWMLMLKEDQQHYYIRPNSRTRDPRFVLMWNMVDYVEPQFSHQADHSDSSSGSFSSMGRDQYDCQYRRSRHTFAQEFSGHMGSGKTLRWENLIDSWEPVEPGTFTEQIWRVACGLTVVDIKPADYTDGEKIVQRAQFNDFNLKNWKN